MFYLIAYFSCTSTTKGVAAKLNQATSSTLFEIQPLIPYTSEDLAYNNNNCRANLEQNDNKARPKIKNTLQDSSSYSTIFLGYPIWWNKAPKIIYTFLESYDFSSSIIIPFCTSGSSSISNSERELKEAFSSYQLKEGKRFSSSVSVEELKTWVKEVL